MALALVIVDDRVSFRSCARRLLEAEGYTVVGEADDGASALEVVLALRPDVVLLDVQLPDTSGFDVATSLANVPHGPVVILTSAHDVSDYHLRLKTCGAIGFVPKAELSGVALDELLARTRGS